MSGKKTKTYRINDCKYQFNVEVFNHLFELVKKRRNMKCKELEEEIGEACHVGSDAVHNWRFEQNAPIDLDVLSLLARFLELEDYSSLLMEERKEQKMQIIDRQKDSLKRLYIAVIDYLEIFDKTFGFNDMWHTLVEEGIDSEDVEEKLYELAESEQEKVIKVFREEYLDLHTLDIYESLKELVYDKITESYNGKLSYAYRFEAPVELVGGGHAGVTLEEDISKIHSWLNKLMEPYFS